MYKCIESKVVFFLYYSRFTTTEMSVDDTSLLLFLNVNNAMKCFERAFPDYALRSSLSHERIEQYTAPRLTDILRWNNYTSFSDIPDMGRLQAVMGPFVVKTRELHQKLVNAGQDGVNVNVMIFIGVHFSLIQMMSKERSAGAFDRIMFMFGQGKNGQIIRDLGRFFDLTTLHLLPGIVPDTTEIDVIMESVMRMM